MIPTVRILRNARRRLDRRQRRQELDQVLAAEAAALMRDRGFVLHVTNRARSCVWWCGGDHVDARELSAEVAAWLLQNSNVVPVDAGLFEGCPQTWRWIDDP
jgi:hypothetical protein